MKKTMTIQLVGAKELQDLFKKLPDDIKPNTVKRIARKAASPIRSRARQLVPVGPKGNLKRSIKIGVSKFPKASRAAGVFVGPNYGRGKYPGPHGHLVAFGSGERRHATGKSTGRAMSNKPPLGDFIKQAASDVQGEVLRTMTADVRNIVNKEMGKRARRAGRRRLRL